MKKFLLPLFALAAAFNASAQQLAGPCADLFISEYVEGTNQNKAIEIYNPTNAPIDLSGYSIGRFSNGAATLNAQTIIQLSGTIQPFTTYVAVLEKRDTTGAGQEKPIFNGYQVMLMNTDQVSGMPLLGANGDTLYRAATYGPTATSKFQWQQTYNPRWDLIGKANGTFCAVYATNNTLYHNGDDAMALIKGTAVTSNVIDVVGIIGEDPGAAWTDPNATNPYLVQVTMDRTLAREANVKKGSYTSAANGDVFSPTGWKVYSQDYFLGLGSHTCDCYVSTENVKEQAIKFQLFPNPANKGNVAFRTIEIIRSVTVTDVAGRVLNVIKGDNIQSLDATQLSAGVYMVTLENAKGERGTQKLIMQ